MVSGLGTLSLPEEDHLRFDWEAARPDGSPHFRLLNLIRREGQVTFKVVNATDKDQPEIELEVVYRKRAKPTEETPTTGNQRRR